MRRVCGRCRNVTDEFGWCRTCSDAKWRSRREEADGTQRRREVAAAEDATNAAIDLILARDQSDPERAARARERLGLADDAAVWSAATRGGTRYAERGASARWVTR